VASGLDEVPDSFLIIDGLNCEAVICVKSAEIFLTLCSQFSNPQFASSLLSLALSLSLFLSPSLSHISLFTSFVTGCFFDQFPLWQTVP